MLAALNSFRAGLEGFPPGSASAGVVTGVGAVVAGRRERAALESGRVASACQHRFGSFPADDTRGYSRRVTLGSLTILQGGCLHWGCFS